MRTFRVWYVTKMPSDTHWLRASISVQYPIWNDEAIKSLALAKIKTMNYSDRGAAVYRFEKIEKDI